MRCRVLQLPDGTEIQVGPDRFGVPEVLFQPVSHPAMCFKPIVAELDMQIALLGNAMTGPDTMFSGHIKRSIARLSILYGSAHSSMCSLTQQAVKTEYSYAFRDAKKNSFPACHGPTLSLCLPQELLKSFKGLDSVQRSDGEDLSMQGMTKILSVQEFSHDQL